MQYIIEQFKALTDIPSPSGFTRAVTEYTAAEFEKLGFAPKLTNKGCVLVDLGGEGNPLVLSAHIDTLGGMVAEVKANGRLRITRIGGLVAALFGYLIGIPALLGEAVQRNVPACERLRACEHRPCRDEAQL